VKVLRTLLTLFAVPKTIVMAEKESDVVATLPFIGELTFREIHAVEDGFYCGVHKLKDSEYQREKHYWRMGWLVGDFYNQRIR
jgi:hypothetical protein